MFSVNGIMNCNSTAGLLNTILSYSVTLITVNYFLYDSTEGCWDIIVYVTIGICLVSIGYVYTIVGSIENSVIVDVRVTKITHTIRVCVGLLGVWNFRTIVFEIWYAISIPGIK